MKKQILISLILISSILTMNAQWNGTNPIWTNTNVGIGLSTDITGAKLFTNGGVVIYGNAIANAPITSSLVLDQQVGGVARVMASGANTWNANLAINPYGGNVGIGTTSPNKKLDIFELGDNATISTLLRLNQSNTGNPSNGTGTAIEFAIGNFSNAPATSGKITVANTYYNNNSKMVFSTKNNNVLTDQMIIDNNGNVGIGIATLDTRFKLNVEGTIRASEVKVCLQGGCDFVFKSDYKLMDLKNLEQFIKTNQHLPEIAPEKEMVENGVNMKELQMKLLQKIEELTLYTIEQNKKIEQQNQEMKVMRDRIEKLETDSK